MKGHTPLYVACQHGHVDAARLLLDKGADVTRADKEGRTPLDIAKHPPLFRRRAAQVNLSGFERLVALLEEHYAAKFPLHAVARTGDVDAMTRLLDDGAAIDQTTENGTTPLWIACEHGHADLARLLLERGAEVDRAMKNGQTPLIIACRNGQVDAARLLLENGAEVDRANKNGSTPLYVACKNGHVDLARLLLERSANVDQTRGDGATPLFVACEGGHVDAARLLLEHGAVLDEHGSSALYEGAAVEVRYRGRERYYPGKISRDCGEGKYDIAYDDGDREGGVETRLIRKLPLSPLTIAKENGHAAVVALLEESLPLPAEESLPLPPVPSSNPFKTIFN